MNPLTRAASRLQELRTTAGVSQKEFAHMFGIHPSTYNRYETGDIANIPVEVIHAIAQHYDVSAAWLAGYEKIEYRGSKTQIKTIPILGTVAAGLPVLAQHDVMFYETVPADSGIDYGLIVRGDSMTGARIYDGDIVFVRKQEDVDNGEIAVVLVDEDTATIKRVYKENGTIILHAENPKVKDIRIGREDKRDIKVIGKVKFCRFEVV